MGSARNRPVRAARSRGRAGEDPANPADPAVKGTEKPTVRSEREMGAILAVPERTIAAAKMTLNALSFLHAPNNNILRDALLSIAKDGEPLMYLGATGEEGTPDASVSTSYTIGLPLVWNGIPDLVVLAPSHMYASHAAPLFDKLFDGMSDHAIRCSMDWHLNPGPNPAARQKQLSKYTALPEDLQEAVNDGGMVLTAVPVPVGKGGKVLLSDLGEKVRDRSARESSVRVELELMSNARLREFARERHERNELHFELALSDSLDAEGAGEGAGGQPLGALGSPPLPTGRAAAFATAGELADVLPSSSVLVARLPGV